MEQALIGISALGADVVLTNKATAILTISVLTIIFAEKTTAKISGVTPKIIQIAAFQVNCFISGINTFLYYWLRNLHTATKYLSISMSNLRRYQF